VALEVFSGFGVAVGFSGFGVASGLPGLALVGLGVGVAFGVGVGLGVGVALPAGVALGVGVVLPDFGVESAATPSGVPVGLRAPVLLCGVAPGLGVLTSEVGAGVAAGFFLEPKSQPKNDFCGLGVGSAAASPLGGVAGVEAVDGFDAAAAVLDGFAPLSEAAGLFSSGFLSPEVVEAAAIRLSAGDTSWAQTRAAQALAATTVVRMGKGFGMMEEKIRRGTLPSRTESVERKRKKRHCLRVIRFALSSPVYEITHFHAALDSAGLPP
jgi:hypothetical protein